MGSDKDYFGGWTVDDSDVRAWWRKKGFSLFGVICLVILVSLGLCSRQAQSAPLIHPTTIQDLYQAAIVFGGYKDRCQARRNGCPAPAVVVSFIDDKNTEGQFDWRTPTFIKINTTPHLIPGSLDFNETLIHEFVHYLQWLFGELGPQTGCKVVAIEGPAYAAGAAYLAQFGIKKDYRSQMFDTFIQQTFCEAGDM